MKLEYTHGDSAVLIDGMLYSAKQGAPFVIDVALNLLGLTPQQKQEIVGNTVPSIENLVQIYNMNPKLIKRLVDDFNRAAPGLQILLAAMHK